MVNRPGADGSPPTFSIVLAAHRGPMVLRRALQSVGRQVFRDFETVVVDDGSIDDIAGLVRDIAPESKLVRLDQPADTAAARNAGLRAASGRYAAFLEGGDVWHPRYLHYQRAVYESLPNAIFSTTNYFYDGPDFAGPVRQLVAEPLAENALLHMIMRPFVHTVSSFVAPRSAIVLLGGFAENLARFSGLDLYVRLLAGRPGRPRLACLEKPVPNLPQIAVLTAVEPPDTARDARPDVREIQHSAFIETVFAYDFMAPFAHLKSVCAAKLLDWDREVFHRSDLGRGA